MEIAQDRNHFAVDFLRVGLHFIKRAQASLDVTNRYFVIKCGQRADKGGGRIALHEHHRRLMSFQQRVESAERPRGNIRQRLVRLDDVEIMIRLDRKQHQHIIDHLTMLRSGHHHALKCWILFEQLQHRKKLDDLRTGAEDG